MFIYIINNLLLYKYYIFIFKHKVLRLTIFFIPKYFLYHFQYKNLFKNNNILQEFSQQNAESKFLLI